MIGARSSVLPPRAQSMSATWEAHLGADDYATLERLMARLREITDPFA